MTLFRNLLLENPDTVFYKKKTYSYTTPANKCAFLVYKDEKSGNKTVFGYSAVKKEFLCDDSDVLKDVEELDKAPDINYTSDRDQPDYWAQKAIRQFKSGNNGGGHLQLENLLQGVGRMDRYSDPLLKGRIFEVDDPPKAVTEDSNLKTETAIPSDKSIIVTFWSYNIDKLIPFRKQFDYVIEFNGYTPQEVLYEPGSKIYTYNEFYGIEKPKQTVNEPESTTSTTSRPISRGGFSNHFKVGDKVKFKNLNAYGDIVDIYNDLFVIKITQSEYPLMPVNVDFTSPESGLELDTRGQVNQSDSLEKVIDDKTQEFVEKRGKLHTTGAAFTPAEKANLEKEVDSLEIELKILNDLLNNGIKTYTDNVKSVVATSVQRKLDAKEKEKQDRYSLIAQAEKQYGMPIAQIRQKYRGVPLDKLVKKESLYKKLLKALRG